MLPSMISPIRSMMKRIGLVVWPVGPRRTMTAVIGAMRKRESRAATTARGRTAAARPAART
jgi:hypothetical protein